MDGRQAASRQVQAEVMFGVGSNLSSAESIVFGISSEQKAHMAVMKR